MENRRQSPKRLVVEAVRDNLRRTQKALLQEVSARASCETSWAKTEESGNWSEQNERDRNAALAGYDEKIAEIEKEIQTWESALAHALDLLEGRA